MSINDRIEAIKDAIANTYGGETAGMRAVLEDRNDRAVTPDSIWQVGTDVVLALSKNPIGSDWMVRSLYTGREYNAEDSAFLYFCQEPNA